MDKIKLKRLRPNAILPTRSHSDDAGLDFYACESPNFVYQKNGQILYIEYATGWAVQPPLGYHIELVPRSSVSSKTNLVLANSVGIVDPAFRGEIVWRYRLIGNALKDEVLIYNKKDRVGQAIIRKTIIMDVEEVPELEIQNSIFSGDSFYIVDSSLNVT